MVVDQEQIERAKDEFEEYCKIRAERNNAGGLRLYSTKSDGQMCDVEFVRHVGKTIAEDVEIFISGLREFDDHIEIWFNELPECKNLAKLLIKFINKHSCKTDQAELIAILKEAGYDVEIDRQYKLADNKI